ncbi:SulP family inorganic anion transporter [Paraburkholderia sp. CNPSo 3157]|uniref:SulP family inorganic anion transporter n=1 Tax=Paraburkholderia franconis TaxID=2654983 RepID=A0A7X1NF99_9BURK|nr:SulP family inorganic anion transporter [Paraburkholderia franconis]MPW20824.1 SulP family inorganic anion transporter [Paraburkholderia franconis]
MHTPSVSRLSTLRSDVFAGIVVFLVALPLCLGIAAASGATPFAGVVSGIIGGLVVALLSGSHLSVSGPAAGLVVIVVSAIASLGSFSAFLAAVLIAGALQIGFGLLRAGRLASFVPVAVIKGMLASIGIMLIVKQIPLGAGLITGADANAAHAATLATPFGQVSPVSIVLAVLSVATLFAWETPRAKRLAITRMLPGPLAVVALGIGVTLALNLLAPALALPAEHRVSLMSLDSLDALVGVISMPDLTQLVDADVWRVALTLAVVASLETLLSLEAVEQIDPRRRRASPDRELKAQGVGNMVAAALGGLPLTAVIVRSSANVHAGAQTRMSAVIHGVLLLASVFALTAVLNLIPLACLAAILIHTGYKLAKPALFAAMAREGIDRFVPFAATIAGVLATDLLIGIGIGIATSAMLAMRANLSRTFTLTRHDDHFLLCLRKDATFLSKPMLTHCLAQIPDRSTVLIDAERADFIDRDIRETLDAFVSEAPRREITVERLRWPETSAQEGRALLPSLRVMG